MLYRIVLNAFCYDLRESYVLCSTGADCKVQQQSRTGLNEAFLSILSLPPKYHHQNFLNINQVFMGYG